MLQKPSPTRQVYVANLQKCWPPALRPLALRDCACSSGSAIETRTPAHTPLNASTAATTGSI
eukprot:4984798-Alexandrium_andersonii.AAC.1